MLCCPSCSLTLFSIAESPHSYENNERSKLYENMAEELGQKGPVFLGEGKTSQSLKVCSFSVCFFFSLLEADNSSGMAYCAIDAVPSDVEFHLLMVVCVVVRFIFCG